MTAAERMVHVESLRIPQARQDYGSLAALCESIRTDGLHHPITAWSDGTVISGARRLRAYFLLAGDYLSIPTVFVSTIEEAAKRMLIDNQDTEAALPMRPSDMCRLWQVLRRLDGPAAVLRANEARRRGVELRRQTQAGKRKPGRNGNRSEDYQLAVISEPFQMSEATASRLWRIFSMATGLLPVAPDRQDLARQALDSLDAGRSSIWASYAALVSTSAPPSLPPSALNALNAPAGQVPAARQQQAWSKSLPQMEGLVAGLAELGPPHPELTWEQVEPVHARLMAVRRDLEKIIKKMRESNKS